MTDRKPSGYRMRMSVPTAVRFSAPGVNPLSATRPPNVTSPLASRARTPSTRTPPASNVIWPLIASSECGSDSCRTRPFSIAALPENTGFASGPLMSAVSLAPPELRMSR